MARRLAAFICGFIISQSLARIDATYNLVHLELGRLPAMLSCFSAAALARLSAAVLARLSVAALARLSAMVSSSLRHS